jgi:hypothetical protein
MPLRRLRSRANQMQFDNLASHARRNDWRSAPKQACMGGAAMSPPSKPFAPAIAPIQGSCR